MLHGECLACSVLIEGRNQPRSNGQRLHIFTRTSHSLHFNHFQLMLWVGRARAPFAPAPPACRRAGAQQQVGVQQKIWGAPHRSPGSCRLNLRELGPWASHMRWIIWIMASVGTVYVFFFHERSVPLPSPALPFLPRKPPCNSPAVREAIDGDVRIDRQTWGPWAASWAGGSHPYPIRCAFKRLQLCGRDVGVRMCCHECVLPRGGTRWKAKAPKAFPKPSVRAASSRLDVGTPVVAPVDG